MDFCLLGGDCHHLAAAPSHRAHIAVLDILGCHHLFAGGVDLVHRKGNLEPHDGCRMEQAFGMFTQLEDMTAVNPFPLEHTTAIVETVGQHMGLGVAPRHHFAVEPDHAVAVIEGKQGHKKRTPEKAALNPGRLGHTIAGQG